jgi:hypothetical protein
MVEFLLSVVGYRTAEGVIIVVASLALAAPVQAALGVGEPFWYVGKWAFPTSCG